MMWTMKTLNKLNKRSDGVITVFVALMLASVLSLGTLVIEASRFQAAKNQISDATISAGTSMIAAYDAELYGRYGLLAIDSERFTEARCQDYLNFNADLSPGFFGNRVSRLYSIDGIELDGLYNLTYPSVLKRQILTRSKYHVIPQDYALNLYTEDSIFADLQSKCEYVSGALTSTAGGASASGSSSDVSADMLVALNELYETFKDMKKYDEQANITLSAGTMSNLPSTTGTVESIIPPEDTEAIHDALFHATEIVGSDASKLISTGTTFSQTDVSFSADAMSDMTDGIQDVESLSDSSASAALYASKCKSIAQSINASVNMLSSDKDGNMLLNSYITNYFSNRNYTVDGYAGPGKGSSFSGDNGNFAAACVEYIFGGNASEYVNQEKAYDYIMSIRLINNMYSVFNSSHSFQPGNAYNTLAHVAWAYYETCIDMALLTTYTTAVPIEKSKLFIDVNRPADVAAAFEAKDFVGAMYTMGFFNGTDFSVPGGQEFSYRDMLAVSLWLVPNTTKMLRIADLIQMEMRYIEQYVEMKGATFLMSEQNTFCRVKCRAKLNSILPIVSPGSSGGLNGITFSSIKYAGY